MTIRVLIVGDHSVVRKGYIYSWGWIQSQR